MPVRIPNRGEPDIIEARSTVAGAAKLQDTLTPKVPEMTFAEAIKAALDKNTEAAVIAIDPVTRLIVTSSTHPGIVRVAAIGNSDDSDLQVRLFPDANQTGRALTYDYSAGGDFGDHERFVSIVAPQKPRRTVESLVAAFMSGTFASESEIPVIIVDQEAHVVMLCKRGSNQQELSTIAPVGDVCTIQLAGALEEISGPPENSPAPLVFEGGPTS